MSQCDDCFRQQIAPLMYCMLTFTHSRTWTLGWYHGRGEQCWHVWTPPRRCGSTRENGSALVPECCARELPSCGENKPTLLELNTLSTHEALAWAARRQSSSFSAPPASTQVASRHGFECWSLHNWSVKVRHSDAHLCVYHQHADWLKIIQLDSSDSYSR